MTGGAALNPPSAIRNPQSQRGGILLLVLWLTAALSFVALALALSVRTELAATQYRLEAEQGRFLARGALEQAIYALKFPGLRDAKNKPLYEPGQRHMDFSYTTGTARVTVMSESGKLNVNTTPVERLQLLLEVAGADESAAKEIAEAIADWRTPAASSVDSSLDLFYAGLTPPYRAAHRPFERLEELLLVKGITPELFYGWMERDGSGRLIRRGGLNRLLTTYGNYGQVNVNYAPYEVLRSVPGMDAEQARALVAGRREKPYRSMAELPLSLPLEALPYLALFESSDLYTLTVTGRPQGGAARASASAILRRERTGLMRLLVWQEQAVDEDWTVESMNQSSMDQ